MFGVNLLKSNAGNVGGATLDVYFLNVGQGNCVIVKFPNGRYMLVDAGSTSGSTDPNTVQGWINTIMGNNSFSTIVITHPDDDHNNLIPGIAQAQSPNIVHISYTELDYKQPIQNWFNLVKANNGKIQTYVDNYSESKPQIDFYSGKNCSVYILAANVQGDPNTHSIVLSIDYKNITALLTGDATSSTERFILKEWDAGSLKSELLSFGHHGSNHSSSKGFLKTTAPNSGVFSASSYHQGYGHPRCEVIDYVETLADEGGKKNMVIPMHRIDCWNTQQGQYVCEKNNLGVFLTATQGNIKFTTDGNLYEVWVDTDGGNCPP
jgi:competence protein ComEC